eukprot:9446973-Pyramimonas_sp.AAC.1
MAQLLGGDATRRARGIPAVKRGDKSRGDVKLQCETAKRFIDEICTVSARPLAEVDEKLRVVIRDAGTQKRDDGGVPRAFG